MRLIASVAVAILAAGVTLTTAPTARAQVIFYDSISNASAIGGTTGTPRFFMGDSVSFGGVPSGPVTINKIDLVLRSSATVNYNALSVSLQFWNENTGSATDYFTDAASGVLTYDLGSILGTTSLTASTNYAFSLILPNVTFTNPFQNGIAINYRGDTGSGLANTNNLSAGIRVGPTGPAVGGHDFAGNPQGGFLRAASGRTDFNFDRDGDVIGGISGQQNAALAMRISYDQSLAVPEASTAALAGLGLLALGAGALKRRRAKSDTTL